jgi:hypothetical protein
VIQIFGNNDQDEAVFNYVDIKVDEYVVSIPCIWQKFECQINTLRFRFLFKKSRFQVTVTTRVKDARFQFKQQDYALAGKHKVVLYFNPGIRDTQINFWPKDVQHRTVHLPINSGIYQINLQGWALNRYGVLYENLNYVYAKKRHLLSAAGCGLFRTEFGTHKLIEHIDLLFRHASGRVELKYVKEHLVAQLLSIIPFERQSLVRLAIDPALNGVIGKILAIFYDNFGFYPDFTVGVVFDSTQKHRITLQFKPDSRPLTTNRSNNIFVLGIGKTGQEMSKLLDHISACIN